MKRLLLWILGWVVVGLVIAAIRASLHGPPWTGVTASCLCGVAWGLAAARNRRGRRDSGEAPPGNEAKPEDDFEDPDAVWRRVMTRTDHPNSPDLEIVHMECGHGQIVKRARTAYRTHEPCAFCTGMKKAARDEALANADLTDVAVEDLRAELDAWGKR